MILCDDDIAVYELAYHLHMPVYKLAEEMPYEEFMGWMTYFERRPIGWREDNRVYTQLRFKGLKERPEKVFQSLDPIFNPRKYDQEAMNTLKGSNLMARLMQAKGGDVVSVLQDI